MLGPPIAFPYMVLAIPGAFAFVAFTAVGLGDYVRVLAPQVPLETIAVGSIAVGAVIAALNVQLGAAVTGVFLGIEVLALALLAGDVSAYGLISIALLVGRPRGLLGTHYRSPFFPVLPLFCVVFTALAVVADWMDPDAGRPSTILLTSVFLLALGYYYLNLRHRPATWLSATADEPVAPVID